MANIPASPTPDPPPSIRLEPGAHLAVGLLWQELRPLVLGQAPSGHLAGEVDGSIEAGVPSVDPAVVRRDRHVVAVADELGAGRNRFSLVGGYTVPSRSSVVAPHRLTPPSAAPETSRSPSSE
jgi:hypothetical protein